MASLNKVFLIGNLTRDPEVKVLTTGTEIAKMGLAVNRKFTGKDGQEREEVLFIDVNAFGRVAANCGKYLKKGSPLMVEGRLKLEEWEKDGKKNSRITVSADNIQFLGGGRGSGEDGGYAPRTGASRTGRSEAGVGDPFDEKPPRAAAGGDGAGDSDDVPF